MILIYVSITRRLLWISDTRCLSLISFLLSIPSIGWDYLKNKICSSRSLLDWQDLRFLDFSVLFSDQDHHDSFICNLRTDFFFFSGKHDSLGISSAKHYMIYLSLQMKAPLISFSERKGKNDNRKQTEKKTSIMTWEKSLLDFRWQIYSHFLSSVSLTQTLMQTLDDV